MPPRRLPAPGGPRRTLSTPERRLAPGGSKMYRSRVKRLMISPSACLVVAVLLARGAALAGEIADTDPDQPINVTADSSPGWLPSLDQTRQVRRTVRDYLAAKDGGQY